MIKKDSRCSGCSACYNVCPANAIKMIEDEKGFRYPEVDREKCTKCGLCNSVCTYQNKLIVDNNPIAYACFNKDISIRMDSSSGGIFDCLSRLIIEEKKGIVYGASFDNEWKVVHCRIDNSQEINKLRNSKYVQSSINDTFKQAKKDLDIGKCVLYTGTPCQIDGLLNFLGNKKYDNLYTQDIVCHGVPSPKVWEKYLEFRRKKDKDYPLRINFRHKEYGWNLFSLLLQYNNSAYKTNHHDDLFMQAFLRNACLRDSCYDCYSKTKHRRSDITLADFWGIKHVLPKMYDNKGVSLVIINSDKGKKLFELISNNLIYNEVNFEESIKYNPAMYESTKSPNYRNEFFDNLNSVEFDKLVKKYTIKPKLIKRIYWKTKYFLKGK